jgi:hypothetical protein
LERIECSALSATLSVSFCAESHRKANSPEGIKAGFRAACRLCPIGARNAGTTEFVDRSPLFASKTCARCERQSRRLVWNQICVSCYNRQREHKTGVNKRGNPLVKIHSYHAASVRFLTTEGVQKVRHYTVETEREARRCVEIQVTDLKAILSVELVRL